jgi:transcriptional regulator with XRE-family HTH domain
MNRIRHWREQRGLSQAELAKRIGTSQPNFYRLEAGDQRLTVEMMRKLAKALNISPLDLLSAAVCAGLAQDVEKAGTEGMAESVVRALAVKKLAPYKVLTPALERAGFAPGSTTIVDESKAAIAAVKTGDAVIADVREIGATESYCVLRQFIAPGMLTTNRSGANAVFDVASDDMIVTLRGIATPT